MLIPQYISDKTAEGLVLKMVQNNLKMGQTFNYEPPLFAKGKFYTFYYINIDPTTLIPREGQDVNTKTK